MPESSIDITSPQAGTTQPFSLAVAVSYDNQSGGPVWIQVTCSFMSGASTGHTVTSTTTVPSGPGTFDANFPHTSGQTNVTISASLNQFQTADGILYAQDSVGDITIAQNRQIQIDLPGGLRPLGYETFLITGKKKDGSPLRLLTDTTLPLVLTGTFDKTVGDSVGIVIVGGKKKRPHIVYEARDAEVVVDKTVTPAKWTATIPAKALQGTKPRGALAILYDTDRSYVAADSAGLRGS